MKSQNMDSPYLAGTTADRSSTGARVGMLVSIGLSIIVLVVNVVLAHRWYAAGLFSLDDALFDADLMNNLTAIAHGWGRRTLVHPHYASLFAVPIRAVQFLWGAISPIADPKVFRESLALWIAPLSTFAATLFFAAIVRRVVADTVNQVLITAVYDLSFTVLVFGSVPEAFPISNLLITALLYLAQRQQTATQSPWIWRVVGILAASITITNLALYGLIRVASGASAAGNDRLRILRTSALEVLAIGMFVMGTGQLAIVALGYTEEAKASNVQSYISSFVSFEPHRVLRNVVTTGEAVAQSVVGGAPRFRALTFCGHLNSCRAVELSRPDLDLQAIAFSVITILLAGGLLLQGARLPKDRPWILVLAGVLGFNFALHAVFGREIVLFSSHWITAVVLILATATPRLVRVGAPAIIIVQIITAVSLLPKLVALVQGV